jgi:UDP-glucose 4-epimerase
MNVFVTGASGFSGNVIVHTLAKHGFNIYAHIGSGSKGSILSGMKGVSGIFDNSSRIEMWPKNIDAIVHAAAYSPYINMDLDKAIESNIIFTHSLVKYAESITPNLIIYLSTISIYGDNVAPIVDPSCRLNNPDLYGLSKLMCEKIIENSKIPSIAIRLPGIVGPNSVRNWLTTIRQKAVAGEDIEIFNVNSLFNNVIHVEDLANFIGHLLENKFNQFIPLTIGTCDPMTIREVASIVIKHNNGLSKLVVKENTKSSFLISNESAIELGYLPKSTFEVVEKFSRGL